MENKLDSFLNRESAEAQVEEEPIEAVAEAPADEAPAEVVEQPAAEAKPEERQRVPKGQPGAGQFAKGEAAPKGDEEAGAPPAPEEDAGPIPVSALKAERSKRQAAEDQVRELSARLAAISQQQAPQQQAQPVVQQQQEQAPPDRWDDPEGYDRWLVSQVTATATATARAEAMQAFQYQRIATAAEDAKSRLPDYGEKIAVFEQMVVANPNLLDQMYSAPNPAEFAYNTANIQIQINQHGGLEGMIAARVQEALQGQQAAAPTPQTPSVPDTLADAQSSRGAATTAAPPSLNTILGR